MTGALVVIERHTLLRWRRAVMAAFGLGGITVAAWGPRLPAVKVELGIGTATIGLLLVGAVAMAVMGVAIALRSVPLVSVAFLFVGLGIGTLDVLINVEGSSIER